MTDYRWQNASFPRPPRTVDETVISFVEDAVEPGFSLTLAREATTTKTSLAAHVETSISELRAVVSQYKVEKARDLEAGGRKAMMVRATLVVDNATRVQTQIFITAPKDLCVVTMTATTAAAERGQQALNDLIDGLSFDG